MPNRHLNRKHKSKFCTGCGHESHALNSNMLCPHCVAAEVIALASASQFPRQAQKIVASPTPAPTGNSRYELSFMTQFGIRAVLKFNRSEEAWAKFSHYQERRTAGLKLYDALENKTLATHDGSNRV